MPTARSGRDALVFVGRITTVVRITAVVRITTVVRVALVPKHRAARATAAGNERQLSDARTDR